MGGTSSDETIFISIFQSRPTRTRFMKAIQFVHPMFLVAVGLHASVMFIPLGPEESDSTLIAEDVPLASVTESPQPQKPGVLPVPDLNMTTGTANIGTFPPVPPSPVRMVANPAPLPPTAGAVRATPVTQPASVPNTPAIAPESPALVLPNLTAGRSDEEKEILRESGSTDAANSNQNTTAATADDSASEKDSPTLPSLVASAKTEPSDFLVSLIEYLTDGLTYRPEGANDASAQRATGQWKASFGQQANAAQIETVEPVLISDVALAYPIKSVKTMAGQSLSVCLDKPPENAQIGLLFDSDGERVNQPVLIRSTGYDILNLEALALVTSAENLPNQRASKAYLYDVTVDYDAEACVSLKKLRN